jgi:anionic cell wall polymer biosynthesis LytR-Cps2A-Psr (LCP) family protein
VKINALYGLGGANAIKQELSSRLGRPIQHHLIIKLLTFTTSFDFQKLQKALVLGG